MNIDTFNTRYFYIIMFLIVVPRMTFCQNILNDPFRSRIINEAQSMANALVEKDYNKFIDYMPPRLIEEIGGRDTLLGIFKQGLPNGTSIKKMTISNLSDTVICNNEIQCTLSETIEVIIKEGLMIYKSTLIGFSFDNGDRWYFIDCSKKTLEQLKSTFPNLSDRLVVILPSKPYFIKE
jgi:hypothetical protein